ncbi:MAG: LuxR C-terminal-related transcriptional regulator [Cellulomonadaceae bacterium]|jgi:sugar-specific transcriptional regulator TrmB/DNA-binding CsgD family transcriptional regulator|nr:LuxR C-terminal-related transcriptional regulator [Cellulomonadaceae bacterium]
MGDEHEGTHVSAGAVYKAILGANSVSVPELTEQYRSVEPTDMATIVDGLLELGLVRPSLTQPGAVRAPDPEATFIRALTAVIARLQNDASVLTEAVAQLNPASGHHLQSPNVEHLVGRDSIISAIAGLTARARMFVHNVLPTVPTAEVLASAVSEDIPMLERGLQQLSIYPADAAEAPQVHRYSQATSAYDAEIRTHVFTPARIIMTDRGEAIIVDSYQHESPTAVHVTNPIIVDLLASLFNHVWDGAQPLPREGETGVLTPREAHVLQRFSMGDTYDGISHATGLSKRTLRRIIADLSDRCGARSLFELAVRAERLGWLPHP